jgi:hypothetical protein
MSSCHSLVKGHLVQQKVQALDFTVLFRKFTFLFRTFFPKRIGIWILRVNQSSEAFAKK